LRLWTATRRQPGRDWILPCQPFVLTVSHKTRSLVDLSRPPAPTLDRLTGPFQENRCVPSSIIATLASAALVFAAGCADGADKDEDAWQASIETVRSVTTVRTLSGSVWQDTAILCEQASIGAVEGEEVYLLGNVVGVAAHGDRIYVLDEQVPVLRAYDFHGRHVRDIGRKGDGPGEFRNPAGVGVSCDGLIFVHDGSQGRISVFTADGEFVETRRTRPFNTYVPPLKVSHDGIPYIPELMNPADPIHLWKTAMVGYGPNGPVGDTLAPPEFAYEPPRLPAQGERSVSYNIVPFAPRLVWTMTPSRATVAGVPEDYRFQVRHADGKTTLIEKASWEPVPVLADEAAWHRRFMTVMNRAVEPGWVWNGPPIPEHKPAYSHLVGDRSGRIWVARPGPGERLEGGTEDSQNPGDFWFNPLWRDGLLVDVFEETGRYLGPVKVPTGIRFSVPQPYIEGDLVVAVVIGEHGAQYVRRYRLMLRTEHRPAELGLE
jgi:hypothetical protein